MQSLCALLFTHLKRHRIRRRRESPVNPDHEPASITFEATLLRLIWRSYARVSLFLVLAGLVCTQGFAASESPVDNASRPTLSDAGPDVAVQGDGGLQTNTDPA